MFYISLLSFGVEAHDSLVSIITISYDLYRT